MDASKLAMLHSAVREAEPGRHIALTVRRSSSLCDAFQLNSLIIGLRCLIERTVHASDIIANLRDILLEDQKAPHDSKRYSLCYGTAAGIVLLQITALECLPEGLI